VERSDLEASCQARGLSGGDMGQCVPKVRCGILRVCAVGPSRLRSHEIMALDPVSTGLVFKIAPAAAAARPAAVQVCAHAAGPLLAGRYRPTTCFCRLAQTGEGIKECELVQWFVNEGDTVEEFTRVCEVQSDKATIEITSPYAGMNT
jgi:hypothetical protein